MNRALGCAAGAVTFIAYLPGAGRSLDFDSAQTVGQFVRPGPPWRVFTKQQVFNNHPFFSFLEQLMRVTTGSTSATTMRILPMAFGAATVGVLTWWCARRWSIVAGVAAGLVVAVNPTFVELSRAVRGYSLVALCAVVSTVLLVGALERRTAVDDAWQVRDLAYVLVVAAGIGTHLFMVFVLAAHGGAVAGARRLDRRWGVQFAATLVVGALAYGGMAREMIDANGAHARVFKAALPGDIATMALGDGWAAVVLALAVAAALVWLLPSRPIRFALAGVAAVFVVQWLVLRSDALTERFFVFVIPAVGALVGFAVHHLRALSVIAAVGAVLAVASIHGYTNDPTGYRAAARVIDAVGARGGRSCVVDVGVPPMTGYRDTPRQFDAVTDPAQLPPCDVVVVAADWHSSEPWFARDNAVIATAETEFAHQTFVGAGDPARVFSRQPLSNWLGDA